MSYQKFTLRLAIIVTLLCSASAGLSAMLEGAPAFAPRLFLRIVSAPNGCPNQLLLVGLLLLRKREERGDSFIESGNHGTVAVRVIDVVVAHGRIVICEGLSVLAGEDFEELARHDRTAVVLLAADEDRRVARLG